MLRIGIVAGEVSGDLLGAGLIRAIRQQHPDAVFEGIAGEQMVAAGCHAIFPQERLAVMGLVEVLGRYRELVGIRRQLISHFIDNPPDVFIGIDAPDFNLGLELKLKEAGIKTVHYVSPSVWAWRQYRVKKIARAVDLMLTLFPFEADFYRKHEVQVEFVGHPLADMIPLIPDQSQARQVLSLPDGAKVVALLPGSRMSEVKAIGPTLIETAVMLQSRHPDLNFVVPLATDATRALFQSLLSGHAVANLQVVRGQAREVMAAADVVVLASGTATLEAMLMKRPMVVTYRMAKLTYCIYRRLLKTKHVALPNLLAGDESLVPELLQEAATAENISQAVEEYLNSDDKAQALTQRFSEIHHSIRRNASDSAARAVLALVAN